MGQVLFDSVQFLRFFAASMVVICHAVIGIGAAPIVDMPQWVFRWFWIGSADAPVSFVISSFVMHVAAFEKFGKAGASCVFGSPCHADLPDLLGLRPCLIAVSCDPRP